MQIGFLNSMRAATQPVLVGRYVALGAAVLVRRWAGAACIGMIVLALAYLGAASLFTPALWADPLGPLLKVIPATAAALACLVALGQGR